MKIKIIYNTFYLQISMMFNNSLLYQQLLKEHTKEEVDVIFQEELQKRNITDYKEFIQNYKREYTEETIVKYVDLVSFFQLDIQDDFSKYLLYKYILSEKYLDLICNFHCISFCIEELCKNVNGLIDEQLLYISFFVNVIELNLYRNVSITNEGLKFCCNLQILDADDNKKITTCQAFSNSLIELYADESAINDEGLKNCEKLQLLDAQNNPNITNCLPFSISLINLNASCDCGIDDIGLQDCKNLQILNACNNKKISTCEPFCNSLIELDASISSYYVLNINIGYINDNGLINCHNLQILDASNNLNITTCEPFAQTLIKLKASDYCKIDNKGLQYCINLQKLDANENSKITTCKPFAQCLLELYATYNCGIDDTGLLNCNKLKILDISYNTKITTLESFSSNLTKLGIMGNCNISDKELVNCINLQILYASGNKNITLCTPFANSLIELDVSWNCGINNEEIKKCINLKKLHSYKNLNITIKI